MESKAGNQESGRYSVENPSFAQLASLRLTRHPVTIEFTKNGTDALREAVSSAFFTDTQFFNAAPMAAALATLKELKRIDGANKMLNTGRTITEGMADIADGHGYGLKVTGLPSIPYIRLTTKEDPFTYTFSLYRSAICLPQS